MRPIQELKDILCTVKRCNDDIMELRFGCRVSISDLWMWMHRASTYTYEIIDIRNNNKEWANILDKIFLCSSRGWSHDVGSWYRPKEWFPRRIEILKKWEDKSIKVVKWDTFDDFKILWNPIQERHLQMYCEEKGIFMHHLQSWKIIFNSSIYVKLDNTLDFAQQEDETIQAIVDFLTKNPWKTD